MWVFTYKENMNTAHKSNSTSSWFGSAKTTTLAPSRSAVPLARKEAGGGSERERTLVRKLPINWMFSEAAAEHTSLNLCITFLHFIGKAGENVAKVDMKCASHGDLL